MKGSLWLIVFLFDFVRCSDGAYPLPQPWTTEESWFPWSSTTPTGAGLSGKNFCVEHVCAFSEQHQKWICYDTYHKEILWVFKLESELVCVFSKQYHKRICYDTCNTQENVEPGAFSCHPEHILAVTPQQEAHGKDHTPLQQRQLCCSQRLPVM